MTIWSGRWILPTMLAVRLTRITMLSFLFQRLRPVICVLMCDAVHRLRLWQSTRRLLPYGRFSTDLILVTLTSITMLGRLPLEYHDYVFSSRFNVWLRLAVRCHLICRFHYCVVFIFVILLKKCTLFLSVFTVPSCGMFFLGTMQPLFSSLVRPWSLPNLNNTCYVNAVLQILFAVDDFCSEAEALVDFRFLSVSHFPKAFREFVELSRARRRGNLDIVNTCLR